ncbi:MAG: [Fe-Fe] hydrogenase large subunit C-terminal domain-containing protein [Christensenellaceae bacterium]
MEKYFHSVRLEKDKCSGCTNCIKRCPTEAIRVQKGKAKILAERCIDCGECIRVCPYHAKNAVTDPLSSINSFKYKIALPAPVLYAQFKTLGSVQRLLSGLKIMGFDDVYEVAKGAEICSKAIAKRLKETKIHPLISSACPAVVRLIQVRFPELLDNIVDVDAPVEVAAKVAKMEFAKKNNVDISEIGAYFITPCPAKMTSIKSPLAKEKSDVDGAISVLEVYGLLAGQLKTSNKHDFTEFEGDKASAKGIGWANSGGETYAVGEKNALAVDGISNVIKAIEDIENDKLKDLDFFEGLACVGGCVGGPLVFESAFVAQARVKKICEMIGFDKEIETKAQAYADEGVADLKERLESVDIMKLDDDRYVALQKIQQIEELVQKLPGMDCGSCGAPSCRSLAEDIVRGYANEIDCIFLLKERVRYLAEEMVDLASKDSIKEDKE